VQSHRYRHPPILTRIPEFVGVRSVKTPPMTSSKMTPQGPRGQFHTSAITDRRGGWGMGGRAGSPIRAGFRTPRQEPGSAYRRILSIQR
jgi:hypothetical protein